MTHSASEDEKEKEKEAIGTDVEEAPFPQHATFPPWLDLNKVFALLNPLTCCIPSHLKQKPLYTPLPHPSSIRLLLIHPGLPSTPVKLTLVKARLDRRLPAYEALSYVWRLKPEERPVVCNGHTKTVTRNLCEALERLRLQKGRRLIWVDALCICQDDEAEKSAQVRMMDQIYRKAERVVVWLGTDDKDRAGSAFKVLCALADAHSASSSSSPNTPASYSTIIPDQKIEHLPAPPPLNSPLWLSVLYFFINKWFLRMWVMQEIVLARSATFLWGAAAIDWTIVGAAIEAVRADTYLNMLLESRNLQNAFFMHHLCGLQTGGRETRLPVLHLLDLARSFDVGDPRDKVYGLLGFLTGEGEKGFVRPRYGIGVGEMYTEVAWKLLAEEEGGLDVLSFTVHSEHDAELKMPSWVPDWNSKFVVYPFMGFDANNRFAAGTGKPMELEESSSETALRLRGVSVTRVQETGSRMPFEPMQKATARLRELVEWCGRARVSVSTLAMTLTAGKTKDGQLIDDVEEHEANFCALLADLDADFLRNKWPDEADALSTLAAGKGHAEQAKEALWRYSCYRAPFVTEDGKLGLGPGAAQAGDLVVVLWGGQVPFVVREVEGGLFYRFVGECYVEWLMRGKVVGMVERGDCAESVFELR
ncbi:heterokaryon incompatibility protein-domain-containing protein [Massariosphaeria phaeospora]|uniref:Heterokaryon incompatibility protein-domain-containing protein n=1 Tax=Massariosphaeria phaeospora TaxID=100035 RepID=A0A7C8I7B8_9PLEO|nr:heterokaryon incompatibility protein-domain-containing protein [Massariosphaeria phaeospora]